METVLARLRAKTDRELGILVAKQLHRAQKYAGDGAYRDAAKEYLSAKALLSVAEIPSPRRAKLECMMNEVRETIERPLTAVA